MTCVACGHGIMHERETGSGITAECHACGAFIRAVFETPADYDAQRAYVMV